MDAVRQSTLNAPTTYCSQQPQSCYVYQPSDTGHSASTGDKCFPGQSIPDLRGLFHWTQRRRLFWHQWHGPFGITARRSATDQLLSRGLWLCPAVQDNWTSCAISADASRTLRDGWVLYCLCVTVATQHTLLDWPQLITRKNCRASAPPSCTKPEIMGRIPTSGVATRGTGGTRPPTCPKDQFWDSSKSDEKLVNEGWGWGYHSVTFNNLVQSRKKRCPTIVLTLTFVYSEW